MADSGASSGLACLMAGRELAREGFKTLIFEQMNYVGGSFWIGGYLMNKATFCEAWRQILDEVGMPYEKGGDESIGRHF